MTPARLTWRQRASWLAHVAKAVRLRHHRELIADLRPHLPANGVVLDIGAHAGQFAKLFAELAPDGAVHAFEPAAYAHSVLAAMLRLRRHRNIQAHRLGLSDRIGEAVLSVPLKRGRSLAFGLSHLGDHGPGEVRRERVALTTVDAFAAAQGLPRLDLIKADIEGWEIRMLRGAAASLHRFRPALLLELNAEHLARAGTEPGEAWQRLRALGYRARRLGPDGAPADDGFRGDGDYLFSCPPAHAGPGE